MPTKTRDLASGIAFLTRSLKAPTLREAVTRLAERARAESWTYEEFLAACLQREVAAGESKLPRRPNRLFRRAAGNLTAALLLPRCGPCSLGIALETVALVAAHLVRWVLEPPWCSGLPT